MAEEVSAMAGPGQGTTVDSGAPVANPWNNAWGGNRLGGPLRFLFTTVWLIYLVPAVADLFGHHHSPLWIAGGLVITVAFCVIYSRMLYTWDRPTRIRTGWLWAACFALAVVACLVYGSDWVTLWIYVSSATGFLVPVRSRAIRAVFGVMCCFLVMCWITHANSGIFLGDLLPVLLLGVVMSGFRMQMILMQELQRARDEVVKLAASEERLRLARDMHDLTGQSLSMVTLKSELVAKLLTRLPASPERDRALGEVTEISQVSRQTLHDIREAVSGYRRPTLAVEIITARTALEAASIDLDDDPSLTLQSGTFDADAEAALAWCLREATTNVIRHSGATTCKVRLRRHDGEISLEVSDDGQGLPLSATGIADTVDTAATPAGAGSGLHGMSERLTALGGRLAIGHAKTVGNDRGGLRLVATVPESPHNAVPVPEPTPGTKVPL
ncbi:MAG TPA: sensor histidine kinase [Streptosporangiaceae bacterium]